MSTMDFLNDIIGMSNESFAERPGFQEGSSEKGSAVDVDIVQLDRSGDEMVAAIEDSAEELSRVGVGVEVTTSAADGIADVAETAEEQIEDRGELSPESYAVLSAAVRHMAASVGFSTEAFNRRVSMESFTGYKEDRINASRIAMESIKDTLKDAWRRIKAFFNKMWEKLKNFIKSTFTAKGRMKKLVSLAKDMAAKSTAGAIKHEKIKSAEKIIGVYGLANIKGDVSHIPSELKKQNDNMSKLSAAGAEIALEAGKASVELANLSGKYNQSLDDYKALDKIVEERQVKLSEFIDKQVDAFDKEFTIVGGLKISGVDDYKNNRRKDSLDTGSLSKIKFIKSKDSVPALSGEVTLKALADALNDLYATFEEHCDEMNSYQRGRDSLRQAVDKAATEAAKENGNGAARGIKPGHMNKIYGIAEHFSPVKYVGAIIGALNSLANNIINNADSKVKEEKAKEVTDVKADVQQTTEEITNNETGSGGSPASES